MPLGTINQCRFVYIRFYNCPQGGTYSGYQNLTFYSGSMNWIENMCSNARMHVVTGMPIQQQDSWAGCYHRNGQALPQCLCKIQGRC